MSFVVVSKLTVFFFLINLIINEEFFFKIITKFQVHPIYLKFFSFQKINLQYKRLRKLTQKQMEVFTRPLQLVIIPLYYIVQLLNSIYFSFICGSSFRHNAGKWNILQKYKRFEISLEIL